MIEALRSKEAERLNALHQHNILDTDQELAFDDITLLASQICGTEIAMISLVDRDRQWFKSKVGTTTETHKVSGLRVLVVDDNTTNLQILWHQLLSWNMSPESAAGGSCQRGPI